MARSNMRGHKNIKGSDRSETSVDNLLCAIVFPNFQISKYCVFMYRELMPTPWICIKLISGTTA